MKSSILTVFFVLISTQATNAFDASITATAGGFGNPLFDSALGSNEIADGSLGILLIDTLGDGILLEEFSALADNQFWGTTDNYVAGIVGSSNIFNDSVVSFSSESYSGDDAVFTSDQPFFIAWFPDLSVTDTVILAGEVYGLSSDPSWLTPSSGSLQSLLPAGNGGNAQFTVSPVPEPSTYALFAGLLTLGFIAVRRSRSRA